MYERNVFIITHFLYHIIYYSKLISQRIIHDTNTIRYSINLGTANAFAENFLSLQILINFCPYSMNYPDEYHHPCYFDY